MRIETDGNTAINIIQGDTVNKTIEITGIEFDLITRIVFSCERLKICKDLEKRVKESAYALELSPEITKDLPVVSTTYDLTLFIQDETIYTVVYNGLLFVSEKKNKIKEV